jgi:hypothetical protein
MNDFRISTRMGGLGYQRLLASNLTRSTHT